MIVDQPLVFIIQFLLLGLIIKLSCGFQTRNTRGNAGDRALQREIERAKQLSLNENKAKKDRCTARESDKENANKEFSTRSERKSDGMVKAPSKATMISSQSDSDTPQSVPNINVQPKILPADSETRKTKVAGAENKMLESDSDDEFRISPPESSEHSSSESDFKLSQISSEPSEEVEAGSSDEEFRLSSEDEFSSSSKTKKAKPKMKVNPKKPNVAPKTNVNVNNIPSRSPLNVSPRANNATTTSNKSPKTASPSGKSKTRTRKTLSAKLLTSSSGVKTVNIPALLSSSQSPSANPSPLGVKIGLSKNARFKSLHANIKRQ